MVEGKRPARPNSDEYFKIFSLEDCGVDPEFLQTIVEPTFDGLGWDYYDVRRAQIDIIRKSGMNLLEKDEGRLKEYYLGEAPFESISYLFRQLSPRTQQKFLRTLPSRRKAATDLLLRRSKGLSGWETKIGEHSPVAQNVGEADYRSLPRTYQTVSEQVLSTPDFKRLIEGVAELVTEVKGDIDTIKMTCWQMETVATAHTEGSNSPEGIHQDGADFIVSALVIARKNVQGGTSRIFGPDKEKPKLEQTLHPGQGIFQVDAGSNLWHDVTPISVEDPEQGTGIRSLLGFDIYVDKKE